MTPTDQRIAIAKACGWTDINLYEDNAGPSYWNGYPPTDVGLSKTGEWEAVKASRHEALPNYCFSLDAMHKAELVCVPLRAQGIFIYVMNLVEVLKQSTHESISFTREELLNACIFATAAQRAEAFLRTIGKWTED